MHNGKEWEHTNTHNFRAGINLGGQLIQSFHLIIDKTKSRRDKVTFSYLHRSQSYVGPDLGVKHTSEYSDQCSFPYIISSKSGLCSKMWISFIFHQRTQEHLSVFLFCSGLVFLPFASLGKEGYIITLISILTPCHKTLVYWTPAVFKALYSLASRQDLEGNKIQSYLCTKIISEQRVSSTIEIWPGDRVAQGRKECDLQGWGKAFEKSLKFSWL